MHMHWTDIKWLQLHRGHCCKQLNEWIFWPYNEEGIIITCCFKSSSERHWVTIWLSNPAILWCSWKLIKDDYFLLFTVCIIDKMCTNQSKHNIKYTLKYTEKRVRKERENSPVIWHKHKRTVQLTWTVAHFTFMHRGGRMTLMWGKKAQLYCLFIHTTTMMYALQDNDSGISP